MSRTTEPGPAVAEAAWVEQQLRQLLLLPAVRHALPVQDATVEIEGDAQTTAVQSWLADAEEWYTGLPGLTEAVAAALPATGSERLARLLGVGVLNLTVGEGDPDAGEIARVSWANGTGHGAFVITRGDDDVAEEE